MPKLTPNRERVHKAVLRAIRNHHRRHGCAPSLGDIAAATGIASRQSVHWILRVLLRDDLVAWRPWAARTIRLTPAGMRKAR